MIQYLAVLNMRIDFKRRVETERWYQLLFSFSEMGVFQFSHKSWHSFSLHSSDTRATKLHKFLKSYAVDIQISVKYFAWEILSKSWDKDMLQPTMASLLKYESLLEFQTGKLAVSWFREFQMSQYSNIPSQVFKDYIYPNVSNQKDSCSVFFYVICAS